MSYFYWHGLELSNLILQGYIYGGGHNTFIYILVCLSPTQRQGVLAEFLYQKECGTCSEIAYAHTSYIGNAHFVWATPVESVYTDETLALSALANLLAWVCYYTQHDIYLQVQLFIWRADNQSGLTQLWSISAFVCIRSNICVSGNPQYGGCQALCHEIFLSRKCRCKVIAII